MKKAKPKVLVLSGYGLNCEDETKFAFELAGGSADIVHIEDLIKKPAMLRQYQILAVPGGFSYADDTGSGRAYANKMQNHLLDDLTAFIERDTLTMGICNGFQVLTQLGLLPGALIFNDKPRYLTRWVDVKVRSESPWLMGLKEFSMPIAHGEGKFYAKPALLKKLNTTKSVALLYVKGEISKFLDLPANPNGSLENIAGVLGNGGRVFGLMPHPERALFFTHLPHWTYLKRNYQDKSERMPRFAQGKIIFENAVRYFD